MNDTIWNEWSPRPDDSKKQRLEWNGLAADARVLKWVHVSFSFIPFCLLYNYHPPDKDLVGFFNCITTLQSLRKKFRWDFKLSLGYVSITFLLSISSAMQIRGCTMLYNVPLFPHFERSK